MAAIAAAQAVCTSRPQAARSPSLKLKIFEVEGVSLLCDTSTGVARPLVPAPHLRMLLDAIHCLAHPDVQATRRLFKARLYGQAWVRTFLLGAVIVRHATEARSCGSSRCCCKPSPSQTAISLILLVGPLPTSQEGYTHLLRIIDTFSRWLEAIPVVSTSPQVCTNAVIRYWIARFGIPTLITSDRGPNSQDGVASPVSEDGVQHILTTANHQQANGMVEHFHHQL